MVPEPTFEGVTKSLRFAREKAQTYHSQQFGGTHPHFCWSGNEADICKLIEYIDDQLAQVAYGFMCEAHYRGLRRIERHQRTIDGLGGSEATLSNKSKKGE